MRVLRNCRDSVILGITAALFVCASADAGDGVPPRPDNAALLYYQACIKAGGVTLPEGFTETVLDGEPGAPVRKLVNDASYQEVMRLFTLATSTQECDWGFVPCRMSGRILISNSLARAFEPLVSARAWVLAADGEYVPALEVALGLRQFARHLGNDVRGMRYMSLMMDERALCTIEYVLGRMPPSEDTLTWLERELIDSGPREWRPKETLLKWGDMASSQGAAHAYYVTWRETYVSAIEDDVLRERMLGLTEVEALELARISYGAFVDSVVSVYESEAPYETKYTRLWEVIGQAYAARQKGDPIGLCTEDLDQPASYYWQHVRHVAHVHALKAALRIYLIKAKTGQLPQAMPDVACVDPYSGEDFDYELTEEGFWLGCRVLNIEVDHTRGERARQFDFKVAGKGRLR